MSTTIPGSSATGDNQSTTTKATNKKAGKDKKIKTPLVTPELTKLSYQKEKFVNAYLLDPNQTKAAKTAGYSEKSAKSIGYQLMKNKAIQHAIQEARAQFNGDTGNEFDKIINELWRLSKRYDRLKQGSVSVRALELIGKMRGCLEEKIKAELVIKDGGRTKEYEDLSDDELRESLKRSALRIAETSHPN